MAKTKTAIPGISFIKKLDTIREYKLEANGLRILLIPNASAPVAGCMVTYHVGSRNEAIGYTGATHMLEHLMFKGSKNFNKEKRSTIWHLLETKGALVNATTWFDRTNYYEVVPKEHLSLAIALEADRMRTARIREEDRQSEMTVVRNEFERGENEPMEALDKQLWAIAYQAHPYHHSTIGWRSDIEKVSIERLQQFYNDFYWPNNATVTIAGNFNEKEVLKLIAENFGVHPKAPHAFPDMYTQEPKQEGERRVIVKRTGANMVGIAHKIPDGNHPDIPALIVLDMVLSDGKTSRLYKALVDTAKVMDVTIYSYQLHDPGLFMTYATLTPGTLHELVEKRIKKVYAEVIEKGITARELAYAKRAVRVALGHRRDGIYATLSALNEDLATGVWERFVTLPQEINTVTVVDIKRVAKKYLVEDQSTVGWFVTTSH
ncbi:insulinase family protein [Patescibacteria group bacterium]|nr:insulinase family protein [Patescibacteria group bacterium]